jgi:nucleoside-diphosphate-sugar epimerase
VPNINDLLYHKVVHISGKAHVIPKTKEEANDFFEVNLKGTKNLLTSLGRLSVRPLQIVFISTVAVYGLRKGYNISEKYNAAPNTPYGESKFLAEKEIIDWCENNNCTFLILRLPLIAGTNPPGNLGSMKQAISKSRYPRFKNNSARKSVVLASDVATLISKDIQVSGIYNLTDGIHPRFSEIENALEKRTGTKIKFIIPLWLARILGKLGDIFSKLTKSNFPISSNKVDKIMSSLTFNDSKARRELGWKPNSVIPFIENEL